MYATVLVCVVLIPIYMRLQSLLLLVLILIHFNDVQSLYIFSMQNYVHNWY